MLDNNKKNSDPSSSLDFIFLHYSKLVILIIKKFDSSQKLMTRFFYCFIFLMNFGNYFSNSAF